MTMPSAWALQTALYGHLSSDPDLMAQIGDPARIYDQIPLDAVFPFLTIGEASSRPILGADDAFEHDIRINAFSRWGGRREGKVLMDLICARLEEASFPATTIRIVQSRFVFGDIVRFVDPDTYQTVIRYRMVTEAV